VAAAHNLPRQLTSFVGREGQIAELERLIGGARMLTLTGPGGVGKSRLALEVAARVVDHFADGVWQVELAPLVDPQLVPREIASVLEIRESGSAPLVETLVASLARRCVLLVLDNCEHLLAGCAALAERLLRDCPELRILTTSRQVLSVHGEIAWQVPPLTLSIPGRPVTDSEAVRLFVDRASAASNSFDMSDATAPGVVDVCHRLDGIPLAIELAAARVRVLSPAEIAGRLDHRFELLLGGVRRGLPRHQTLWAALAWSYDLLSADEKRLFEHLSVFVGGWTLEAAESVCGGDPILADQVLHLLSNLVDKSLVVAEPQADDGSTRYRLLETLREFAGERLAANGGLERVRAKHAEFYLKLAERGSDGLHRRSLIPRWLHRLERDYENLRAALSLLIDQHNTDAAARMVYALRHFWFYRGYLSDARGLIDRVLALPGSDEGLARVRAVHALGLVAFRQDEFRLAERALSEAVSLARELGDLSKAGAALTMLAYTVKTNGDPVRARSCSQEQVEIGRTIGDPYYEAAGLTSLANSLVDEGQFAVARPLLERALALSTQLDVNVGGTAAHDLAMVCYEHGDYAQARHLLEKLLEQRRGAGQRWGRMLAASSLGWVSTAQGDWTRASCVLLEAVSEAAEVGDRNELARALDSLAALSAALAQHTRAMRLAGAAAALRANVHVPVAPALRSRIERSLRPAVAALGEAEASKAFAAGQALGIDDIVADALAQRVPAPAEASIAPLTAREQEVAALLARGFSNPQIADQLVIARATVERHIANMLLKLDMHSRSQIAAWATERGLH